MTRGRATLRVAASLALIALMGCSALTEGSGAPPAGQVHFGRSFDTNTFAVQQPLTSVGISEPVAIVAHFTRQVSQNIRFELVQGGAVVYTEAVPLAREGEVYGVVVQPEARLFPSPGTYTIRFRDAGGNQLAQGDLTVTQ